MRRDEVSLTEGAIVKKLIIFAVPLLGSSLVQQLYNTVDLIFVGKLLGKDASAAVGAGSLLITCLLGFFGGLSVGTGIVAARAFGERNTGKLENIVHTAAGLSIVGGIIFSVAGWIFVPEILLWMNTPETIMGMAVRYIRIYILSLLPVISYNMSAGILRALGDSRSPMVYQLLGGISNILANVLFICVLKLGVTGAALATLCSQGTAAVLIVCHLCRMKTEYRLQPRKIHVSGTVAGSVLRIGIPAAVQSMAITFSNLFVQSQINSLGVVSMAAFAAYFKVENFIYLPILAIGQAVTMFYGQNIGAGLLQRAQNGIWVAIVTGVAITLGISVLLLFGAELAFGLFANDTAVVALGIKLARLTFPYYFFYVFLEVFSAGIRGGGRSLAPMLIIICNMCVVRIAVLKIMMQLYDSVLGVAVIYPVTWFTAGICMMGYYFKIKKEK